MVTAVGVALSAGPSFVGMQNLHQKVREAVRLFWQTREGQAKKQAAAGKAADMGERASVTGGKQMDGFAELVSDLLTQNGVPRDWIRSEKQLELPGYYRPEKKWDLVVVGSGKLSAVMEFKSQVGSFGNNFNNRTEEAIGSAVDLRGAFDAGAVGIDPPWLGYLMLLQKAPGSTHPVKAEEPNFEVLPEFKGASYAKRYEILCERLVSQKLYDGSCFLLSEGLRGSTAHYEEPNPARSFLPFITGLLEHVVPRVGQGVRQQRLP